jgi:peptidoglycan hydrolase CwlO-like protein
MIWISIIALLVSIIGVGVAYFAYKEAQKANKTILRQNTQSEINRIQSEIYQIDKEIEHLEAPTKGVYGIYRDVSQTNRISNLNARKRDLEQQLKQLKGEIGPACNAGK